MRLHVIIFLLVLLFDFTAQDNRRFASVYPPNITLEEEEKSETLPLPDKVANKIDRYFAKRAEWRSFNGTVLFAKGNQVFQEAYGFKSLHLKDSLNVHTPFQLASVSKPITATAVLQLVEKGELALTDTIARYFPDLPYEGITVEMLLTHRSGLPNYIYLTDDNWEDHRAAMTNEEAYQILLTDRPNRYYPPGYKYNYSNSNYFLLARLVESVTGQSFPEYLDKNVFKPAGMHNAFVLNDGCYREKENVAIGHDKFARELPEYYLNSVYGDKSIFASVIDLYAFDRALKRNVLLSDSMQALAYQPHTKRWYSDSEYGLGWRLKEQDKRKLAYHNGWWRGFRTYYIRDLTNDITIAVLHNSMTGSSFNQGVLLRLMDDLTGEV